MLVRLTKIADNKILYSQADNKIVINSCFDFCVPYIRKRVCTFLESDKCKRLTLYFKDHNIRLEKRC